MKNRLHITLWLSLLTHGYCLPSQEKPDYKIYAEVDYLLWFANQDGLSYTTIANTTLPVTNETILTEHDKFLHPGWSSGVKVVLGTGPSLWDASLSYIYYYTKTNGHSSANSNSLPSSSLITNAGTIILNDSTYQLFQEFPGAMDFSIHAHWKLLFNRIDGEFGKRILFNSDSTLLPFFGLEGICINQTYSDHTNTVFLSLDDGLPILDVIKLHNKNRFLSIGPKGGFKTTLSFGHGFGFYGNLSGSLLWGKFKIQQSYSETTIDSSNTTTPVGQETIYHSHLASLFNGNIGLGFHWRYLFEKANCLLGIKLGWEGEFYTNINRFQNFYFEQINSNHVLHSFDRNLQKGNLSLSGFVFGISTLY